MKKVVVLIGAGSIGVAIARRIGFGKHILLADLKSENTMAVTKTLSEAGYDVSETIVDISSRKSIKNLVKTATSLGNVTNLIQAAGVSPSQASPETILKVDLYGTAVILEEFGKVIANGGTGVVIASQSGHRLDPLTKEQKEQLALTPTEELLNLPLVKEITDSLRAYQISKQGNSLRVAAESVKWGQKGARINTISPGIIMTPLAKDELTGPRKNGYLKMLNATVTKRAGTSDEIATLAALIMGEDGAFINGSDFLIDGGVTANFLYGDLNK